ncbi:MAG: ammonia-forming cytochrome c nitrite reductase subunit c552 [Planctomycetes bacterium]|nr:ammonia-forming cytochrome c nitrite reductase subunit c552 [Planctomycetota bacterium]
MKLTRSGRTALWIVALFSALATAGVLALYDNVSTRKHEAQTSIVRLAPIDETTVDPKEWGKTFPRQYDSYLRTVDVERTKYGGSENVQKLDDDPLLRTIFAGYAFSIDYREERGHAYMLSDQRETERVTKKKQPGACLHCHASNVVAYREAGLEAGAPGKLTDALLSKDGMAQLMTGFEKLCAIPYDEVTKKVSHPVACLDCHDPESMAVRITKPGFLNGIRALASSSDPVPHLPSVERWRQGAKTTEYDPNRDASRQEMRSMVCGQCHVEYYFKGDGKLVTFPWQNGLKVENIEAYYEEVGFTDWTHAKSGAKVLKAQHPEFEMWSQGIHAKSGVSCADCHMPYKREGAQKFSDHHVNSPLLHVERSCQVCHPYSDTEVKSRVETIQARTKKLLDAAERATVDLIDALEKAKAAGATESDLAAAFELQRKAQWRTDFVAAENSMGFHAPQEAARILGEAIDLARQGQIAVLSLGAKQQ